MYVIGLVHGTSGSYQSSCVLCPVGFLKSVGGSHLHSTWTCHIIESWWLILALSQNATPANPILEVFMPNVLTL